MLKISRSSDSAIQPGNDVVGVDDKSRVEYDKSKLDGSEFDSGEVDGGKIEDDEVEKKVQKTFKSKTLSKSKKTVGSLDFFTLGTKLAFTKLKQAFFKASILHHFDPEHHI